MSATASSPASALPVRERWVVLALVALAALVFANVLGNGFVWDDIGIILENPDNRRPLDVARVFASPDVVWAEDSNPYYRPLNRLLYLLEYRLWGPTSTPFHAVSVAVHLLNIALLFLLGRRLGAGLAGATLLAALFGLHPVVTEAVNFISGRNNLLATSFVLLSLLAWLRRQAGGPGALRWGVVSAVLFGLGLLCKETALMLLPLLLLAGTGSGMNPGSLGLRLRALLPHAGVAIGYFVLRALALQGSLGVPLPLEGLGTRLLAVHAMAVHYALTLVWPFKLNAIYTLPPEAATGTVASWLACAGLVAALVWAWRIGGLARFGVAWVVLNLIPIAGIVPIPSAPMADRYAYLPSIGFWMILVGSLGLLGAGRAWLAGGAAIIVLALAALTVERNRVWRNDLTLFANVVARDPGSVQGHFNLGNAWRESGDLERARGAWERAVALAPDHTRALNQLGNVQYLAQDWLRAVDYYQRAIGVDPGNSAAHYNLARVYEFTGQPQAALPHYEAFLQRRPPSEAHLDVSARLRIAEILAAPNPATMAPGSGRQR